MKIKYVEEIKKEKAFFDLIIDCLAYIFVYRDFNMGLWDFVRSNWKDSPFVAKFFRLNFWSI